MQLLFSVIFASRVHAKSTAGEYNTTVSISEQYHFCRRQKYHAEQHEAYHLIHFIPHSAVNIIL